MAGLILLGWSVVAAVVVSIHPGANPLDRWGFALLVKSDSSVLIRITDLGAAPALVVGSVIAALMAVFRDRWRAVCCVAGPLLAALLVEYVFKPLVGRHYEGVLSYPSGNVTDVAAVATAWVIAAPRRMRPVVIALAAVAVALMAVAVVGLRWHYPSDALGGAVLGVGVVLALDGLVHLATTAAKTSAPGRTRDPRTDAYTA